MEIALFADAIKDLEFWKKSGNQVVQKKIANLLVSIKETPFEGIGKPEALKHANPGNGQGGSTRSIELSTKLKEN